MFHFKPPLLFGLCSFILLGWWMSTSALAGKPRMPYEIQADRMEFELKIFKRFEYLRNRDEQRERRTYERLSDRQRLATIFINGQNRPRTQAAFRAAVQQLETSPASAEVLLTSVPPLGAEQFVATSRFRRILRPDGSLTHAPPILVGHSGNSPLDAARVEMEDVWRQTLQLVGADSLISYDHIAAMQHALDRWKQLAAENFSRSDFFARRHGEEYLKSVGSLIKAVEDPIRREQLQSYYYGSGMAFDGGTVADLVHHVLSNNLSIRPGSSAQLILSELGHDMLRGLDGQVQLADQRVEYYKVQNKQSALDPKLYGAQLPQRRDGGSPGSVPTSVERLRQILTNGGNHRSTQGPNVTKHVVWRN